MKKYEHIMSINLVIKSNSEERPSKEEILKELNEFLKEDPNLESVEWVDTEEAD